MSRKYGPVQVRWQRRYGGRRWVMGVPVDPEPIGSMVDDCIALDIASLRVAHALRAALLRPIARRLAR